MKFNHFSRYLIIILAFCWACNKKDVIPNRPPASFTVKATLDADGKTVKLVWNRAIDPDSDNVTYAVFAKDTLAKNVSDTTIHLLI